MTLLVRFLPLGILGTIMNSAVAYSVLLFSLVLFDLFIEGVKNMAVWLFYFLSLPLNTGYLNKTILIKILDYNPVASWVSPRPITRASMLHCHPCFACSYRVYNISLILLYIQIWCCPAKILAFYASFTYSSFGCFEVHSLMVVSL